MSESKRIVKLVAALFAVSFAVQAAIWFAGGIESDAFQVLGPIVMFFPGIAALIYLKVTREGWSFVNWRLGRPIYLLYGMFIPAVTGLLCVAIITSLGLGYSPHLETNNGTVIIHGGQFVLGRGQQSLVFFALNFLLTTIVLSLVNGLVTVGEEVGWRGFFQPKFVSRKGFTVGITVLGVMWALWHAPIILMGYNYPETPVLGAFVLWPLTCILVSFVFAWLTINAQSIWPAVLAHGSWNAFHGGLVDGMEFTSGRVLPELISLAIWLIVALLVFALTRRQTST